MPHSWPGLPDTEIQDLHTLTSSVWICHKKMSIFFPPVPDIDIRECFSDCINTKLSKTLQHEREGIHPGGLLWSVLHSQPSGQWYWVFMTDEWGKYYGLSLPLQMGKLWVKRFSNLSKVTQWVISLADLNPGLFWAWWVWAEQWLVGFPTQKPLLWSSSLFMLLLLYLLGFL